MYVCTQDDNNLIIITDSSLDAADQCQELQQGPCSDGHTALEENIGLFGQGYQILRDLIENLFEAYLQETKYVMLRTVKCAGTVTSMKQIIFRTLFY